MSVIRSYSQNREDIYINWLLNGKKNGFYVDVGASDPSHFSVTKFFYDHGWRGINIEPIPEHFKDLETQRPRDINLNIGIAPKPGKFIFHEYVGADGLSTFVDGPIQKADRQRIKSYEVDTLPLRTVFENHLGKEQPDFLKVDVEGYEYEVLASNDWGEFHPRLIIVEANHINKDWRPIIESAGYSKVFFDGLNEYYTKDKEILKNSLQTYSNFLIGPTILDEKLYDHIEWLKGDVVNKEERKYQARLEEQERFFREERRLVEIQLEQLRNELRAPYAQKMIRIHLDIIKRVHQKIRKIIDSSELPANYQNTYSIKSAHLARKKPKSLHRALLTADIKNYKYQVQARNKLFLRKMAVLPLRVADRFGMTAWLLVKKARRRTSNG